MDKLGPVIGEHDEFEARYMERFRSLVSPYGLHVRYERDRATLDTGLHLTGSVGEQRRVSHTRIWFQLKGIHNSTLDASTFAAAKDVALTVDLNHLKFWFASPEPIYLTVYVEAADLFIAEDVRDIVFRKWGDEFLAPTTFPAEQQTVTVRLQKNAALDANQITSMRRHQSMRIDGPYFRGRPLGHRLDPLRCYLAKMEPESYLLLITRLLEVHDYRPAESLETGLLFEANQPARAHVQLTRGTLYSTFEWIPSDFTQFGIDPNSDYRIEGAPEFAHGSVAVCIDGDPKTPPRVEAVQAFAAELSRLKVARLLVFGNTDEDSYFSPYSRVFRTGAILCRPQPLRDLGYSLLTATVVYLEFREAISWKITNYR